MSTKRNRIAMFSVGLAVVLWTGAAIAPARAGVLGGLVDKARRKAEAELRQRADEAAAQIDRKLAELAREVESEVGRRIDAVAGQAVGATGEAARVAEQIEALVEETRRRSASAQPAPLAVFGLDVESGAIPKEVIIASLSQTIALLEQAHAKAETDEARRQIVGLGRDITAIRDRLTEGNLAAAQEIMDLRWSWVMAE